MVTLGVETGARRLAREFGLPFGIVLLQLDASADRGLRYGRVKQLVKEDRDDGADDRGTP